MATEEGNSKVTGTDSIHLALAEIRETLRQLRDDIRIIRRGRAIQPLSTAGPAPFSVAPPSTAVSSSAVPSQATNIAPPDPSPSAAPPDPSPNAAPPDPCPNAAPAGPRPNAGPLTVTASPVWGSRSVDCFEKLAQVGEGTYGQAYSAKDNRTGEIVALKKIRRDSEREGFPIAAIREFEILKKLHHENVIKLKEVVTSSGPTKDEQSLRSEGTDNHPPDLGPYLLTKARDVISHGNNPKRTRVLIEGNPRSERSFPDLRLEDKPILIGGEIDMKIRFSLILI